ncbi:hypothetical protein GQ42DRAFT_26539 [Ramicandelaber brevisporus]|nr:hypothetical protein GQ42DRAFT_26539 [Ramicandelaber brevisporus]
MTMIAARHPLTSRLPGMVPDEASIPEGLSMGILSSKYLPSTVVGGPSLSSRTMAESDPSRTSRSHRSQRNTVNSAQDAHHMVTSFFAIKRMRSLKRRSLRRWLSVTSSSRRRLRRYRRHTISLCRVTDTHVDASTYHSWWTVIDTMRQIRNKQDGRYAVIRSRRIKSSRM